MALSVEIEKCLGDFQLQVQLEASRLPLALLGASGCGKSLTLRCIAGILKPDRGHIELNGKVLFDSAAHIDLPPQARHIGYLFQQYALFPNMTVRQNIGTAIPDRKLRAAQVEASLKQFHLEELADLRPGQLSGGQQQRTALARILASQPELILLDEPLSALDSYLRYQLELELAETLEQFQGPVLWVTHDRGEAFRNCKEVCVLDRGCSQGVTTLETLFSAPGTEAAARLSGCKNYVDAVPKGDTLWLPQWQLSLPCSLSIPPDTNRLGIRAHHVHPSGDGFPCHVVRVIEDVFSTIVLLRPVDALSDAPLLRMELSREAWHTPADTLVRVAVEPEHLIFLTSKGEF